MKILHLNTYDVGGAATAVYRFHQSLLREGHQSVIMVRDKTKEDPLVHQFKIINPFWFARYKLYKASNLLMRTDPKYHFYNWNEKFHFPSAHFIKQLPFNPDLICIHWISGFVNTQNIYEISRYARAPVVWRFNDMSAFTGGCHYSHGCTHYHDHCGKCPALYSDNPIDRSFQNLKSKKYWLGKTDLTYISSTTEIDEQLAASALARISKRKKILIGCSTENFFYIPGKENFRLQLGLDPLKKIIYFGAVNLGDERKGYKELVSSFRLLKTMISPELAGKILLVYSSSKGELEQNLPFESKRVPFLKGDAELAKAYRSATVFVSPSVEDAGPIMIAEALLCGTPVVAFEVGLAKDAVINNITGFIAPRPDVNKFAVGMKTLLELPEGNYTAFSERCAVKAAAMFSQQREISEYEELFHTLTHQ